MGIEDIKPNMLEHFNRHQEVAKVWNRHGDDYVLEDYCFTQNWSDEDKSRSVNEHLPDSIRSGGCLFGAFDEEKMIGFASIKGNFVGKEEQHLRLYSMHVSYGYRNKGIGKRLFLLCAEAARKLRAVKLYITAFPAQETITFYRAMGCVYAEEVIPEMFEEEPGDVHMEYVL